MKITLENLSKRYLYDWIIRDMNHVFTSNSITGINGINGSGKSTLIKLLSGYLSPSEGSISYELNQKKVDRSDMYQYISMAAPYTDLIQEYDAEEMFLFHTKFKKIRKQMDVNQFIDKVNLKGNKGKQIQFYSSGMKQRLQLAIALFTDSKLLLLDEPTSYLDNTNKDWFYSLLEEELNDRSIIVASNDLDDFRFCDHTITL
ncbi:MAG: ATP-binding cassette domain-containing protein [Saprospiraceae bacterium]|nr:ATP-binding cassette domain-containing protein [Saprospiraceae bacterium]